MPYTYLAGVASFIALSISVPTLHRAPAAEQDRVARRIDYNEYRPHSSLGGSHAQGIYRDLFYLSANASVTEPAKTCRRVRWRFDSTARQ
jgi:hypothetical protein